MSEGARRDDGAAYADRGGPVTYRRAGRSVRPSRAVVRASRQPASSFFTAAATRPPSARPGHLRVHDLHDGAHGPRPLGAGRLRLLDGLGDDRVQLVVDELLGQVRGEDLALRLLPLGLLGAAALREGLGGLAALLRLAW